MWLCKLPLASFLLVINSCPLFLTAMWLFLSVSTLKNSFFIFWMGVVFAPWSSVVEMSNTGILATVFNLPSLNVIQSRYLPIQCLARVTCWFFWRSWWLYRCVESVNGNHYPKPIKACVSYNVICMEAYFTSSHLFLPSQAVYFAEYERPR